MQVVCIRDCTVPTGGKDRLVQSGEMLEIEPGPWMKHFAPVADGDAPEASGTESPAPPEIAEGGNKGFPRPVGGGWWELSDGERVKGKAKARKAEKALL